MSLQDKIGQDYIQAMKDKDASKSSTLSFLRSQIKYVAIEKKTEKLDDMEIIAIIKKQVKQRQESIAQFSQGGRQDLVAKEQKEVYILKTYLPAEMSESELTSLVAKAIAETATTSM